MKWAYEHCILLLFGQKLDFELNVIYQLESEGQMWNNSWIGMSNSEEKTLERDYIAKSVDS